MISETGQLISLIRHRPNPERLETDSKRLAVHLKPRTENRAFTLKHCARQFGRERMPPRVECARYFAVLERARRATQDFTRFAIFCCASGRAAAAPQGTLNTWTSMGQGLAIIMFVIFGAIHCEDVQ
jgi:hypothetical protein